MKELESMVKELDKCLLNKENEMHNNNKMNCYTFGSLENRRKDIDIFASFTNNIDLHFLNRRLIVRYFFTESEKIKNEIEAIE